MTPPFQVRSLAARLAILAALFSGEALAATFLFDGASAFPSGAWIAALIHSWGSWTARFAIAFSALFVTFAFLRYKSELKSLAGSASHERISWGLLVAHFAAIVMFMAASAGVYSNRLTSQGANVAGVAWIVSAVAAIACAGLAFLPWSFWSDLASVTGRLWIFAAVAALLTCESAGAFRSLWAPASRVTFRMVRVLLSPFVRDMVVQPDLLRIGTHRFTAIIADECSGMEGIGLLLVFGCMWLVLFRNESRFPQALVLLPLGVLTLFLLNAFRITALILIGNAGAREIALGGFHSQAGWIAFNSVAFVSSIVARRWSWVSSRAPMHFDSIASVETDNPTAAYLAPFLGILAAGMLSRAASGSFEWLYPIRFLAVLVTLWIFRRAYARLDWKCGLLAPVTGIAVFLVWIGADRLTGGSASMPGALATATASLRYSWISLRILGAVLTVPIAEELAFRGFALRRFMDADFESIPFNRTTWLALAGSSLLFGVMHGGRWILGSAAGLVYALLIRRTGRMGDAVVAHAVTNALLAAFVIIFGQWQLW